MGNKSKAKKQKRARVESDETADKTTDSISSAMSDFDMEDIVQKVLNSQKFT